MKASNILLSAWLGISLLMLFSCCMPLKQKKEILPEQVYPKPLMGNQTDSLKNYLDVERERRRNQGKE